MIWVLTTLGGVLFKIPLLWRLVTCAVLALSIWGGFKYWKHSIWVDGYRAGEVAVQEEWNEAVRKEIEDGEQVGEDARIDVERAGPDGLRDDPRNRDNWKAGKPGA